MRCRSTAPTALPASTMPSRPGRSRSSTPSPAPARVLATAAALTWTGACHQRDDPGRRPCLRDFDRVLRRWLPQRVIGDHERGERSGERHPAGCQEGPRQRTVGSCLPDRHHLLGHRAEQQVGHRGARAGGVNRAPNIRCHWQQPGRRVPMRAGASRPRAAGSCAAGLVNRRVLH